MKFSARKLTRRESKRIRKLYHWLLWQPSLESAVADLTTRSLRELHAWLTAKGTLEGIPAMVHGLILYEAAGRLMLQKDTHES